MEQSRIRIVGYTEVLQKRRYGKFGPILNVRLRATNRALTESWLIIVVVSRMPPEVSGVLSCPPGACSLRSEKGVRCGSSSQKNSRPQRRRQSRLGL